MAHKSLLLICLSLLLLFISCASHTAVEPEPSHIQFFIQPGESVRVVTYDNKVMEFIVEQVTEDALITRNQKVLYKDIKELDEVNGASVSFTWESITAEILTSLAAEAASSLSQSFNNLKSTRRIVR